VQPGVVTVCVTGYPPFMFYDNQNECPSPCDYGILKGAMPTVGNDVGVALSPDVSLRNKLAADDKSLTGFDRDFVDLIFTRMLGLPVQFHTFGSFTQMYLALLAGKCDVAVTASQMCVSHTHTRTPCMPRTCTAMRVPLRALARAWR
jgi:ABC-type amino acid transport substrate-binding protein